MEYAHKPKLWLFSQQIKTKFVVFFIVLNDLEMHVIYFFIFNLIFKENNNFFTCRVAVQILEF